MIGKKKGRKPGLVSYLAGEWICKKDRVSPGQISHDDDKIFFKENFFYSDITNLNRDWEIIGGLLLEIRVFFQKPSGLIKG